MPSLSRAVTAELGSMYTVYLSNFTSLDIHTRGFPAKETVDRNLLHSSIILPTQTLLLCSTLIRQKIFVVLVLANRT